MYQSVTVALNLTCATCAGEIPVGTLADDIACTHCATANHFPWRGMFDIEIAGQVMSLADVLPGLREGHSLHGASRATRLALTVEPLRCTCGTAFTDDQIQGLNRLRQTIACACGVATPGRKPPDPLVAAYPNVVAVIGETTVAAAAPATGVVAKCGECGARLDGTTCSHCGATNQLPPRAGTITTTPRFGLVFRI